MLLASAVVGRIVYTEHALPAAHAVIFFLHEEEAICRIGGQDQIAAAVDHSVVAFQADQISAADLGWSVCGLGEAYAVVDPVRLAGLAGRAPGYWRLDPGSPLISVPLQRLTGRRIVDGGAVW